MNKKKLKQKLKQEDLVFVQNNKEEILYKVGINKTGKQFTITKKWSFAILSTVIVLIFIFSLFIFTTNSKSTVFIDINPSLSLVLNNKNIVKEAKPSNEDGIVFLEDLTLLDLSIEDAIDLIVDRAFDNGFFTPENAQISFSAITSKQRTKEKINNKINERLHSKVNNIKIIDKTSDATSYGISPDKMAIINKALELDNSLTMEKAIKMKNKDLFLIISNKSESIINKYQQKLTNKNNNEQKFLKLIDQMQIVINNINTKPGKHNQAYIHFKNLYNVYLLLKESLSEEFLNIEAIHAFEDFLNTQKHLLEIIKSLPN